MPSKNETTDDSLHLHVKLISGDPTASTQIAEKHLPRLIMDLKRKFPQVEDHAVETAAEDALMNYLLHPNRFDPSRLPLHNYLRMSARGDLLNVLRRHMVTSDSSRFGEVVELDRLDGEQDIEDLFSPSVDDITLYRNSPVWDRLLELLPDPIDQEIVLLMIENIRSTFTTVQKICSIKAAPTQSSFVRREGREPEIDQDGQVFIEKVLQ
jgi:hypothetical protein